MRRLPKDFGLWDTCDSLRERLFREPMPWVIILAAVIRLYGLGHYTMHLDEASTYFISAAPVKNIFALLNSHMHNAPPLSYVIMHFFLKICDNTFFFRLASAIEGTLAVALIYFMGKHVVSAQAGAVSAFLLAVSPLHIYHSQEARMYALSSLLGILSLFFFMKIPRENDTKHWILWVVATIANLYTQFFAALLLFAQLCCMSFHIAKKWFFDRKFREASAMIWKLALSQFVIAASLLPLMKTIVRPKGEIGTYFFGPPLDWAFAKSLLRDFSTVSTGSMWFFIALFVIGLAVMLRRNARATALLLACGIIPVVLANFYLQKRSYFSPKYVMIALPIFLLFAASGITFLAQIARSSLFPMENGKVSAAILAGLCAAAAGLNAPTLRQYYPSGNALGNPPRDRWNECAAFVKEKASASDAIGFYQGYTQYLYDYYDRKSANAEYWFVPGETIGNLEQRASLLGRHYNYIPLGVYPRFHPNYGNVTDTIGKYDRLWMIYSSPYPQEGTDFLKYLFNKNYEKLAAERFGEDVELVLYRIKRS